MRHLHFSLSPMETAIQLNIPVPNSPSSLAKVGDTLRAANVNILAISCTEGKSTTIIHLVVDDHETAKIVLKPWKITTTKILSFLIKNKPGAIASIGRALAGANINIRYIYATTTGKEARAFVALDDEETEKALKSLAPWKNGLTA